MTEWRVPALVVRVVDGDTVYVTLDLGWHISLYTAVRVAGIDCPEMDTEAGKLARARAVELLPGGLSVTVVSHKLDKYGRVLGTILMSGEESYGALMLSEGHAVPMP
jgi:endonuclease YncB( thermonuclease family)